MPSADHRVISQKSFLGLYTRGVLDSTPDSYFIDCLNNKFAAGEVSTRDGLELNYTKANIVRTYVYKRIGESNRFITLDSSGNLYDSLYTPAIYTDAAILDFSMVVINNRAYITPHNKVTGVTSKSLIVYDGAGTARLAAGAAPSSYTLGAAQSASSGNVEVGWHHFVVAYQTSTGYITGIDETAIKAHQVTADGFKVDLSSIPVGPSGTSSRIILATKSVQDLVYTGNLVGYEFYFVPNGVINDNSTTTLSVNFYDSDLLDSADYLLDNLSTIPAGVFVTSYGGRLVIGGSSANPNTLYVSDVGDPETINSVSGLITLADGCTGLKAAIEFRNSLIIFESNRVSSTTDTGDDAATWKVITIDKSAGTECFGIGATLSRTGSNNDRFIFADRAGLMLYEGYVKRPELSHDIEDTWRRINNAYFNLIQVVDDPIEHRLFVLVPLDSATAISHVLYADYHESFTKYNTIDESQIKWSIWSFPSVPVSVAGDIDNTTKKSVVHFAMASNIYDMKAGLTSDYGNAIDSYFRTALKSVQSGWINHFGAIRLRLVGSGTLTTTLYGEDASNATTASSFTMATAPGLEPLILINYQNEKLSIKFRCATLDKYYTVSRLDVYAKELWLRRPA